MKRYPITIIGCGPGSVEYVTPLARTLADEAQTLVGAQRLLDLFPESPAERIPVTAHITGLLDEIERKREDKRVAVLVTGDPGLLSLARLVLKRFGRENCRVVPGISTLQVAFAALGLDWFDALVVDAHGGLPDVKEETLATAGKIAVFTGGKDSGTWIAALALRLGSGYRCFLCSDLTLPGEIVREMQEMQEVDLLKDSLSSLAMAIFVKKEILP